MIITVIVLLILCLMQSLKAQNAYQIYNSKNGKPTSIASMAKQLAKSQTIFFGEYHDDTVCHAAELEFLQELYKVNPGLIISFEMFERDVQKVVDDYLADKIDEKTFLEQSRPWPNYDTDYRPLLEFAKQHHLPVIAANVPRKYAGMLARQGKDALKALPETERSYFAQKLMVLDDQYKAEFLKTMQQTTMHGMPGMPDMYENMYIAQCLKDDTMAESISQAVRQNPGKTVIHYNGDFHSRAGLGTAQKLKLMQPRLKIKIITPTYIAAQSAYKWDKSLKTEGDFILMIPQQTDQIEDIE